jgi:3-oxoacyl-[acyl-carrier protein] reductase
MGDSVVVVTGGGRGIGRAICERFAAVAEPLCGGSQVVAAARSVEELNETRRIIELSGGRCHVQPTDVGVPQAIDTLIETTVGRFGRIDVLVNNAGVAPSGSVDELKPGQFDTMISVNVNAVYRACRAVWPVMRKQGGGVIINISSVSSIDPFPGFAAYGASKSWVNAWTKAIAEEGRPLNIRVFAVAPGAVETRMLRTVAPEFPADQTLHPADVAEVVHSLAQPVCRYTTGQTIFMKK